jgi:hypothetical protein
MTDASDEAPRDIFGELVPVGNSANALQDLDLGLGNLSNSISDTGIGSGLPFLGISKGGWWHYGQEGIRPDPLATLAVNIRSARHGYICWKDGKPYDRMVAANQPLPPVHELPDYGAKWELGLSIEMAFISGKDKGVKVLYKNNSIGGRKAIAKLVEQIQRQRLTDPSKLIPIIKLETYAYDNKKFGGETTNPVFTLVGFTDGRSAIEAPKASAPSPAAEAPQPAETAGRRRRVS